MENYNKLLEKAKEAYKNCATGAEKRRLESIFPELRESEYDGIRKDLIEFVKQYGNNFYGQFSKASVISWLEKQGEPLDNGEISDGYHTFNELYYYRMLYNAAFFNLLPKEVVHKSKRHHNGEECFGGGWFIVMANLPTGQISNHYELKDWDLFQIPEKEVADQWDGHTPQEAADRLHKYLLEKQGEQKPADTPKFKVGDWIITNDESVHEEYRICRIKRIEDDRYYIDNGFLTKDILEGFDYHLWTIEDAKDGDILTYLLDDDKKLIMIYEGLGGSYDGQVNIHAILEGDDYFDESAVCICCKFMENLTPATKEQRELLFSKMNKAGYKWDSENKELKEIKN